MQQAHAEFLAAVDRVKHLGSIAAYVVAQGGKAAPDVSDVYRAQLVSLVSALDTLVHALVRIGMVDMLRGARQQTGHFANFPLRTEAAIRGIDEAVRVELQNVQTGGALAPSMAWFEAEVLAKHSLLAFQKSEKIADAIRLIHPKPLWDDVASRMGRDADDVKTTLDLIATRRNQIAHESDLDPGNPGMLIPISDQDVASNIAFVCEVGRHIFEIVR